MKQRKVPTLIRKLTRKRDAMTKAEQRKDTNRRKRSKEGAIKVIVCARLSFLFGRGVSVLWRLYKVLDEVGNGGVVGKLWYIRTEVLQAIQHGSAIMFLLTISHLVMWVPGQHTPARRKAVLSQDE